ncbi:MAG: prephenate dehydrogenase [Candidatus Omnitrophica bacterium]|nr:prephenate dehydrogenase [Candidatus Omnitrophota bacterium]
MQAIKKISIIGVGFMGGSLALSIKKSFPQISVWGYARNLTSYNKLKKLNILDKVECDLKALVSDADIVILATPVYLIIKYLKKIANFLKKSTIVTDIGSTKELITKYAKIYLPKNVTFVGCHPLCGSQKSGANFSDPNLYKDAICIVTTPFKKYGVSIIKELWETVGAKVVFISPSLHDKIISTFSHLPHIIAFSLINVANQKILKFAPQSFKDLTRISASSPSVWKDIFLTNKYITADIESFIKFLRQFQVAIKKQDQKTIVKLINEANKKYSLFL